MTPAALLKQDTFLVSWAERELREALGRLETGPYEIFVQGSRANGTAIEPSSDIDLVLMLTTPVESSWEQFAGDVMATLGESWAVRMGRRCLNVDEPDSLFGEMVDILVATEFHIGPEQGVFFRDNEGRPIVNFPKQHRLNGDEKDLRTGGRFKDVVRAAKRAKKLHGLDAPSYLIECLLYNVPDHVYRAFSVEDAYRGAFQWLRESSIDGLPCQNGINRIFGPGPDQWEPGEAGRIIDVLHAI
jgi:hypothetical protein